jgi:uncharacterized membrane protein YsdA (DUF1294 family)
MATYWPYALAAVAFVNVATVLLFWKDKRRALAGQWRVPEADLIFLAMLGGTPGAFLARRWFRHKTRKEPFTTKLLVVLVIQVGAIIGFIIA